MTREEKKQFILKQFSKKTSCAYIAGVGAGFDCTYDAVVKDFETLLKAKDEEIYRLQTQLNSSFVRDVSCWQPIVGSIKNPTPPKKG